MIWLLLPLGVSAAALAHSMWASRQSTQAGDTRNVSLDKALPPAATHTIIAAIMTAKQPAQLDALAAQYRAYPHAAYELAFRAWELRGRRGPSPRRPKVPGVGAPSGAAPSPRSAAGASPAAPPVDLAAEAVAAAGGGGDAPAPGVPAPAALPEAPPVVSAYGAGDGWSVLPSAAGYAFSDPVNTIDLPGDVIVEASRIAQAGIGVGEAQLERAPDGQCWLFVNVQRIVYTIRATPVPQPAQQQSGYIDPMGHKPPYTTEYREDVAGTPPSLVGDEAVEGAPQDTAAQAVAVAIAVESAGAVTAEDTVGSLVPDLTGAIDDDSTAVVELAGGSPDITGGMPDITGGSPDITGAVGVGGRPQAKGNAYVSIRPTDRVWPRRIAEIGTDIDRGSPAAIQFLTDLNPHLAAPGGKTLRELRAGDQVNVPGSWAAKLKAKGFQVGQD